MKFIPQQLFDAALTEIRAGASCCDIADRIGMDCELLGRMLQLPTVKQAASDEPDLWRTDVL